MSWLKVKLEALKLEQIPEIMELDKLCLGGIWSSEGYQRELKSDNSHFLVLKEVDSEKILGYGCFWAILEEAHVTLLAVHPDYQGQGLGKLLLYTLLETAADLKLERATLEVREGNEVAVRLYEKFRFKIAGKRRKYYQKTGEDALILWYGGLGKEKFTLDRQEWQKEIKERLGENKIELRETQSQQQGLE